MASLLMPPASVAVLPVPKFEDLGILVTYDIASTAVLLLIALTVAFVRPITSSDEAAKRDPALDEVTPILIARLEPRRALVFFLLSLIALTYFADGAVNVIRAILVGSWTRPGPVGLVSYILGLAAFGLLAIFLAWKDVEGGGGVVGGAWGRKRVRVFIALATAFHIAHIVLAFTTGHLKRRDAPVGVPEKPLPPSGLYSPLLHLGISILRLLILIVLYPAIANPYKTFVPTSHRAGEDGPIETNGSGEPSSSTAITNPADASYQPSSGLLAPQPQYGTFGSSTGNGLHPSQATSRAATPAASESATSSQPAKPKAGKPSGGEVNLDPSWREMGSRIRRLLPYLWPRGSLHLEGLAFFCLILLVLGRFITFLTPTTLRQLVAMFDRVQGIPPPSPWKLLFTYVLLRFLQGSGGLAALRDIAWAPVMQYSDRKMSQMAFDHLLNLSLAFHTRRKTGEVLRILDRGQAINHIFELILFNVIPAITDIIVALVVFTFWFSWTLSAVVFLVMFTYIVSSVALTSWRTKIRRQMNEKDIITRGIHTDCLLNYETVKYFNGEEHEAERYRIAIENYQRLEFKVMASLNLLNLVQNFIISFGLLIGSILVTVEVVNGTKETSDFIFFITYLAQVYGPLTNLGYIYRSINQSLVDTERLFKLLDESRDVTDKPDAPDLVITHGEIEFRNVSFTYDDRTTALKGLSFKVPPGQSVALVGESGSGKSTILRLLYRFYDLKEGEGAILIDGQDIRDVTQSSLRKAIGVVPQDSVLFNNTINYNIGYGKFGASQGEIEYAAQAAQMHDRILTFPDGYETRVGERGVRLSGGEKQRVSIARTFLKNAPVLLLDEATSALDTTTEKDIQKALQNLLTGRSSLSIAHRLSTIANSDIILVLKDGEIIESGTHKSLLAANGTFATMWAEQISTDGSMLDVTIPKETASSGYDIPPLSAAPQAVIDFTETPVGREAMIPTEPPAVNPLLGPGPVIPPVDVSEVKVEEPEQEQVEEDRDFRANLPSTASDEAPAAPEPAEDFVATTAIEAEPETKAEEESTPAPAEEQPAEPSYAAVAATDLPANTAIPIAFPSSNDEEESAPAPAPVAFPTSSEPEEPEAPAPVAFPTSSDAPVSFPTTTDAPVAFPSDDQSIKQEPGTMTPVRPSVDQGAAAETSSLRSGTGVKFSSPTPEGSATPIMDKEKRRRTISQNMSKLGKRLSLGGRRASMQAAEAARAVAAVNAADGNGERSSSDKPERPISAFMSKLTGRGGDKSGDDSSVKSGSGKVGSGKGASTPAAEDTPTRAQTPAEEAEPADAEEEALAGEGSAAGTKKGKKKSKKGKK
ncbi:hypothetical protein DL93DRAFT_2171132 [Clavulina sp. PMI_390]|nr:hypothetical protein DL93DRAFT_2171132 [Clavulina sp. PMI_390]